MAFLDFERNVSGLSAKSFRQGWNKCILHVQKSISGIERLCKFLKNRLFWILNKKTTEIEEKKSFGVTKEAFNQPRRRIRAPLK